MTNPISHTNIKDCVTDIIDHIGKDIRLGVPLGIGKPNHLVNEFYRRAKEDNSINLTILTALTLEKPKGKSDLEERFLGPMRDRLFGEYPDLDYEIDRTNNRLPANIRVIEFYFPAGKFVHNKQAQRDYMSTNYTHVARDLIDLDINVIAQLVAPSEDGQRVSLSCNPDVSLDLRKEITDRNQAVFVAQTTQSLPYMYGDADVLSSTFDYIIDNRADDYPLFAAPKGPVSDADYMIGLYAGTLVKDGGELQVGIGALGDSLIYGLLLRHKDNQAFKSLVEVLLGNTKDFSIIQKKGGLEPFEKGLFGASEMLVDAFMHLIKNGILKREVYDHPILQRLINEDRIQEDNIGDDILSMLLANGAFGAQLEQKDFDFLQHFGILKDDLRYAHSQITFPDGDVIEADLNVDASQLKILEKGLGSRLKNGAIIHGGFFLGASVFYQWLHEMPENERRKIHMKSVRSINQLYGHEDIDRLHRRDGRFFNTCLMMTLLGAAVSDGLEDGTVISGVGGQYNFVDMAHALPDGHSVIQLRATRSKDGKTTSSIVWNYGHITIPRHLRDIVITEYGIADIRGKTDEEVIIALLQISDSRFQGELMAKAKAAGKLSNDFQLNKQYLNNLPQRLADNLAEYKTKGLFPAFPFGTDFTPEELQLGKALKALKIKTSTPIGMISTLIKSLFKRSASSDVNVLLKRMDLDQPNNLKEKIYRMLLVGELIE